MSSHPPAASSPADPTDARTARDRISATTIAAWVPGPWRAAADASRSSRRWRSASILVSTEAVRAGAARARAPAACQASDGNGRRTGKGSWSASAADSASIRAARAMRPSTQDLADLARPA